MLRSIKIPGSILKVRKRKIFQFHCGLTSSAYVSSSFAHYELSIPLWINVTLQTTANAYGLMLLSIPLWIN